MSTLAIQPAAGDVSPHGQERDVLLHLLDAEIEHLRTERKRGGWTTWALVLALATIAGLAAEVWERGDFSLRLTALLFVLLSVAADFIVQPVFDPKTAPPVGAGRFRVGSYLGWTPVAVSLYALRAVVIAGAAWLSLGIAAVWLSWTVGIWYLLSATITFVLALMLAKGYPIKQTKPTIYVTVGSFVVAVTVVVLIIGYLAHLKALSPGRPLTELRLAALSVAGMYVSMYLLIDRHREPLLDSLLELRRGLALNDITLSDATNRTRIVLSGMAAGDWIQPDLRALLESYDRQIAHDQAARELADLCSRELAQLEQLAAEAKADHPLAQSLKNRLEPIAKLVTDSGTAQKEVGNRSVAIAGRFGFLRGSTAGIGEAEAEYKRAIDPLVSDSIARDVQLTHGHRAFLAEINQRLTALGY